MSEGVPAYDVLLDERGELCPRPIIALARAFADVAGSHRVLLLADDPAVATDVPAWCAIRGRSLEWSGVAPDGRGSAFLVSKA